MCAPLEGEDNQYFENFTGEKEKVVPDSTKNLQETNESSGAASCHPSNLTTKFWVQFRGREGVEEGVC